MSANNLKLVFLVFLISLFTGCSEQQEINSNALTHIILNDLKDPRNKVADSIKYKEYDSKNECYIRRDNQILYCVNIDNAIVSVENGKIFIYAVEDGIELNDNKEKMNAHVNLGSLKFFKFEQVNESELKLISESDLISCGPYGGRCSAVTYKYGYGPELAWVVATGDMHQGYFGSNLSAYTAMGKKISPFLDIQTSYSNENAIRDDEPDATIQILDTRVTTVPSTTEKFFDLKINVTGKEIKKKKSSPVDFSTVIKFDSKSSSYPTDAVKKIYEGTEY
jgi:hypothetical protein